MYITFSYFRSFGFPMPILSSLSSLFLHLLADSWCKRYAVILFYYSLKKTPTVCKLLISGSISLPFSGFFSPFPRGTCPLSVRTTYLEIRGWYPDVRWMITSPTDFNINSFLDFTGLTPSLASVSSDFKSFRKKQFSFFAFARHYLRNLFWFLFLKLLRCFSSLGSLREGFPFWIPVFLRSLHTVFAFRVLSCST